MTRRELRGSLCLLALLTIFLCLTISRGCGNDPLPNPGPTQGTWPDTITAFSRDSAYLSQKAASEEARKPRRKQSKAMRQQNTDTTRHGQQTAAKTRIKRPPVNADRPSPIDSPIDH